MILPQYIDLETWANSLVIDFPNDNVPLLYNKEKWKEWGNQLIQSPTFSTNDAPSPDNYNDPLLWAQDVFYSMNNN